MTSLSEFLLARIAEDEARARAAFGITFVGETPTGDWHALEHEYEGIAVYHWRERTPASPNPCVETTAVTSHITAWSPYRVLAECEAKRQVLTFADEVRAVASLAENGAAGASVVVRGGTPILKALALPYANHPDYRPEWKPWGGE